MNNQIELKKRQDELDAEISYCRKCEKETTWGEVREFGDCLDCYYRAEKKVVECEKCGEETTQKTTGDETYNYCKECNWVTN